MRGERGRASIIAMILLAGVPGTALAAAYTFTPVDVPFAGVTETDANGVNNSGQIVGSYEGQDGIEHGYLYSSGVYTTIDYPGSSQLTQIYSINDVGQMVGTYTVETNFPGSFPNPVLHGFIATTVPTPEPNSAVLVCFGAAFITLHRRWGKKISKQATR